MLYHELPEPRSYGRPIFVMMRVQVLRCELPTLKIVLCFCYSLVTTTHRILWESIHHHHLMAERRCYSIFIRLHHATAAATIAIQIDQSKNRICFPGLVP